MNRQQIVDILKGLTVAGGPLAVLVAMFTGSSVQAEKFVGAIGAVVSIVGVVWIAMGRTDRNMVLDARAIPGVQVHVDTTPDSVAPAAVIATALDKAVTDVFPMEGGPRT